MSKINFTARTIEDPAATATQCAVIPVFGKARLSGAAQKLDRAAGGIIRQALELEDFSGKKGETLLLPASGKAKRILLVGCGESKEADKAVALQFCQRTARARNPPTKNQIKDENRN